MGRKFVRMYVADRTCVADLQVQRERTTDRIQHRGITLPSPTAPSPSVPCAYQGRRLSLLPLHRIADMLGSPSSLCLGGRVTQIEKREFPAAEWRRIRGGCCFDGGWSHQLSPPCLFPRPVVLILIQRTVDIIRMVRMSYVPCRRLSL